MAPKKAAPAPPGGLIAASVTGCHAGGMGPVAAHVPSFGRNPRGSPDFLVYPVPKACMHVLGTGVPRCLDVARCPWSPKAAQALGCSLTPVLRISFGQVTCMARAASVPGQWTLGFLLLHGACVWVWVVLGLGFRLRPATPCLGCWGVCLLVCALRLNLATPGWGVRCLCVCFGSGSGFGCAPPLLAGVLDCLCACVRAPLVPCNPWLGCAAPVCVLALRFRLRPASPGWGVGVCVFVYALRLYPTTPGWGVRPGFVCLGSGFGCAPQLLAGVLRCACARSACTPPLLARVCGVVWDL